MGWSVGFDSSWKRDIGYGVPSICDHPGCGAEIDRGLAYVCGTHAYGGDGGCGLFFCSSHLWFAGPEGEQVCARCDERQNPNSELPLFVPTPDTAEWIQHKLTDPSWGQWREENKELVTSLIRELRDRDVG